MTARCSRQARHASNASATPSLLKGATCAGGSARARVTLALSTSSVPPGVIASVHRARPTPSPTPSTCWRSRCDGVSGLDRDALKAGARGGSRSAKAGDPLRARHEPRPTNNPSSSTPPWPARARSVPPRCHAHPSEAREAARCSWPRAPAPWRSLVAERDDGRARPGGAPLQSSVRRRARFRPRLLRGARRARRPDGPTSRRLSRRRPRSLGHRPGVTSEGAPTTSVFRLGWQGIDITVRPIRTARRLPLLRNRNE